MVGEPEVVVRAHEEHRSPVEQDARALRARDQPQLAIEAELADLLEPLLDLAHHATASNSIVGCSAGSFGSTWTTSRPRLGAPSGRGGTELFFLCRSWRSGFQKFASLWLLIRSSIGVPGASPSSQPDRLSGRGLLPLSGWRATFSPRSSNIARSSSGSEPSVVRKLPIITPFSPAFTASGWSSPRLSTRPPQSRKRASGRIRRKIAIHLTASHGSMKSRSPNLVPARGLSRLIGTLVGSISAS